MTMADQKSVRDVTYDLLRSLGLTTIFGNPGSTEETFLKNFPDDFTYVLGLQEASVLAMADGFAQSTGKPALVNVHTGAGTGNAMGSLVAAYRGNTPLIVTAGQQAREMVLCEPYLTNSQETLLPQPWVKWAYEPKRAEDVPAAFMRAYAIALQPPAGPVFLSIPLDDWDKPALGPAVVRTVSHRVSPDTERLRTFADRINRAQRPMLVFGPEIDRSGAWDAGVAFAEKVGAPVYGSPLPDRASFPENHRLYQGPLPMTIAGAEETLRGHDLAIVIGAQVFRYYPYVAGEYLPEGTDLLQITNDPGLAAAAPVGDSLLGDSLLALENPPNRHWSPSPPRRWPSKCTGCPPPARLPSSRPPAVESAGDCLPRLALRWETAPAESSARWWRPSATDRPSTRCRRSTLRPNIAYRSCSSSCATGSTRFSSRSQSSRKHRVFQA
jgi:benzoylformate decarboxylase